jgi:hypothetical protein
MPLESIAFTLTDLVTGRTRAGALVCPQARYAPMWATNAPRPDPPACLARGLGDSGRVPLTGIEGRELDTIDPAAQPVSLAEDSGGRTCDEHGPSRATAREMGSASSGNWTERTIGIGMGFPRER